MITLDKNAEFTYTIEDFIMQLNDADVYAVKIFTANPELTFTFDNTYDVHFFTEGIRVSKDLNVSYIALEMVIGISINIGKQVEDLW